MSKLTRLRAIAILAPVTFAVALGLFTEEVLRGWTSASAARVIATGILTAGVTVFSFWVFGVIERMQGQIAEHQQRELERAAEMARMEERERIGLELHDSVIQVVYGAQLRLEACLPSFAGDLEAAGSVNASIDDLISVAGKMRQYIFGLRPYLNGEDDLPRALADLLREAEANAGVSSNLQIDSGAVSLLRKDQTFVLFRIAEQAVASAVARGATQLQAKLTSGDEGARLEIGDNGRAAVNGASGWADAVRQQATSAGALLTVDSAEGQTVCTAFVNGRQTPTPRSGAAGKHPAQRVP